MVLTTSALVLKLAGTSVMESHGMGYIERLSINFLIALTSLILCAIAWSVLCNALLLYGYASRIPLMIVHFLALQGHWGTHDDALDPSFPATGFWPIFLRVSFVQTSFSW